MRSIIALLTAMGVALCAGSCAQPSAVPAEAPTSLEMLLVKLEKDSWVAWKARDGRFFANLLADDHVELGQYGPGDKAGVVAFVGSPACVVESYALDGFRLTPITPDTALLVYHAMQKTTCNGQPVPSPVWVSSLYVKRDGRWQNALYQQTPATK